MREGAATKSCRKPLWSAPTRCVGTGAPQFPSRSPALSQERHISFAPYLRKDRLFAPSELAEAMTFLREDYWALLMLLSASETLPEPLQEGKTFPPSSSAQLYTAWGLQQFALGSAWEVSNVNWSLCCYELDKVGAKR